MITEVTAYRLSDGRVLTDRSQAAREEAKIKLQELLFKETGPCEAVSDLLIANATLVCELLKEITNEPTAG